MGRTWVRRSEETSAHASAEVDKRYKALLEGAGCITLIRRRPGSNRNVFIDTFSIRERMQISRLERELVLGTIR
jgi:hypothetical protein